MFVPCPHCGFPLALIVSKDGAAQNCPRCDGALPGGGAAVGNSLPAPSPDNTAADARPAEADIGMVPGTEADDVLAAAPDLVASLIAVDAAMPDAPAAAEPAKPRATTR